MNYITAYAIIIRSIFNCNKLSSNILYQKTDSTRYDSSTPAVIPMQTLNMHLPTGDSKMHSTLSTHQRLFALPPILFHNQRPYSSIFL